MDPVPYYVEKIVTTPHLLYAMLDNVLLGGPPVEVWKGGKKIAVAIHPEEYDLLNRLIDESGHELLNKEN